MAFNPFAHNLGNDAIKYRSPDTPERRQAVIALFAHMYEISDDPTGSDPADYLSPEDVVTCQEIVAQADNEGWSHASLLEMRSGRQIPKTEGLRTWNSPLRTAKAGLTKALFFPRVDSRKGYVFGHISIVPSQAVALCDDGKLRSLRGPELQSSKGIGWGRLPDPEYLMPALAVGYTQGVNYTNAPSDTLSEIFEGRSKNVLQNPGGH